MTALWPLIAAVAAPVLFLAGCRLGACVGRLAERHDMIRATADIDERDLVARLLRRRGLLEERR